MRQIVMHSLPNMAGSDTIHNIHIHIIHTYTRTQWWRQTGEWASDTVWFGFSLQQLAAIVIISMMLLLLLLLLSHYCWLSFTGSSICSRIHTKSEQWWFGWKFINKNVRRHRFILSTTRTTAFPRHARMCVSVCFWQQRQWRSAVKAWNKRKKRIFDRHY